MPEGGGAKSPNGLERPETHLCDAHSGRMTQPGSCPDCALTKRLTRMARRIGALEQRIEELEGET